MCQEATSGQAQTGLITDIERGISLHCRERSRKAKKKHHAKKRLRRWSNLFSFVARSSVYKNLHGVIYCRRDRYISCGSKCVVVISHIGM